MDLRNSVLVEQYRTIYYPIPKVANSSIKTVCANLLGIEIQGSVHGYELPRPKRLFHNLRYKDYFKFAFVRNPWGRLVSCYRDKIQNQASGIDTKFTIREGVANCLARFPEFKAGMTFDEFVEAAHSIPDSKADIHFKSQYAFIGDKTGPNAVDFVGHFERLGEDILEIQQKANWPELKLPHVKSSPKKSYHGYYNDRTRRLVSERYREDIELFGYQFDT